MLQSIHHELRHRFLVHETSTIANKMLFLKWLNITWLYRGRAALLRKSKSVHGTYEAIVDAARGPNLETNAIPRAHHRIFPHPGLLAEAISGSRHITFAIVSSRKLGRSSNRCEFCSAEPLINFNNWRYFLADIVLDAVGRPNQSHNTRFRNEHCAIGDGISARWTWQWWARNGPGRP
jgi:hypothetical protein